MSTALERFLHTHEVIVHLGAHKTATTYIQSALKAQRKVLAAEGVTVLLPGDLRATGVLGRSRPDRGGPNSAERGSGLDIAGLLNGLASDPTVHRIVLSEESIIGAPRINLSTKSLYPDLVRKCRRLPVALNHPNVTFLFALRDYGSFFSSNITTAVRRGNVFALDDLRPAFLTLHRNWVDVVSDLRRAFPAVALKIWRYEDFGQCEAKVFAKFGDGLASSRSPRLFKTLSRDAMAHILTQADPSKPPRELRPFIRNAARDFPITSENPAFSLWSEAEAAHLTRLYDLHWQEICETHPHQILA